MPVPGGTVQITLGAGRLRVGKDDLLHWIDRAVQAVTTTYARFPVKHLQLSISPASDRRGVFAGSTFGTNLPSIRISVGEHTTREQLEDDWILTHEMVHLSFPTLARRHHWLEEGLATYVEPVARAQAGQLPEQRFWREFVRDLPQGLPGPSDRGLDYTPTWARTYWGGALFCFWADLTIRERTTNRHGLQTALRAIVRAGGNVSEKWPLQVALKIADDNIGESVLTNLYEEWKSTPVTPDLERTWLRLGVRVEDQEILLDDTAPWAAIRSRLVRPHGFERVAN